MTTIITTIAIIITAIMLVPLAIIETWEIVAEIKGALHVPAWLDKLYEIVCL